MNNIDLSHLELAILRVVRPYHTSSGNGPDGCKYLCSSCRERRNMRDRIKEIFQSFKENIHE